MKIFCPTVAEEIDQDENELLKISYFYKMLVGVKKIGFLIENNKNIK